MSTKKIPAKLSPSQEVIISHHLRIDERWFGWLFAEKSRLCEQHWIYTDTDKHGKPEQVLKYAKVYAKDAVINQGKSDEQQTIYCYFIFYDSRVWKAENTYKVTEIIDAIRVEHYRFEHEWKIERERDKRYEKLKKERDKKKGAEQLVAKKKKGFSKIKKAA